MIRVKNYEMWNTSITTLVGVSPKVNMVCGSCSYYFSKRFPISETAAGNPKAICPACGIVNYVPIMSS